MGMIERTRERPAAPADPHGPKAAPGRGLTVIDVLDPRQAVRRAAFEAYRDALVAGATGERLLRNYTRERFDLDAQIAVPVVFEEGTDRIFGFSSVFRPAHWPEGTARVGNRTWIDRGARAGAAPLSRRASVDATKTFIELVAAHHVALARREGIGLLVITREAKGRGTSALPYLAKAIDTGPHAFRPDTGGYYQTVPGGGSRDCWQMIMFTEIAPGARALLHRIPRIGVDTYWWRHVADRTLGGGEA